MAPAGKKAKTAAPVPGGGLNKFFASKSADLAAPAAASATPAPTLPTAQQAPVATTAPPSAQAPAGLTDAQKERIEENKRKALERKLAKQNGTDQAVFHNDKQLPIKSPSPLKLAESKQLKRNSSEITPEKVALPEEERRVSSNAAPVADDKFRTFGKVPWMQYNSYYSVRLEKLRGAALAQARSLWSEEVPAHSFLPTITTASAASSSEVVITGITFKDMPSRDNVIQQYRDPKVATSCLPEDDIDKQPNLCSKADIVWLEDATFRMQLNLAAEEIAKLATGFVAAVRGTMTSDGKFDVKSISLVQGLALASVPDPAPLSGDAPGPYIALMSGLFIGAPDEDIQARTRAVDFLLGKSEDKNEQLLGKAVERVIVCGGVYWTESTKDAPTGLEAADSMFSQLAQEKTVDVMPGHRDPSNLSLPQMPLHPLLFRSASKCSQFKSVSNPYQCSLGDMLVLGHSGQPVRDLMRCTSIPTPMQALTTCLDACLLAPTAPDTLTTQPFANTDPFVVETMPQVLFSGGHEKTAYELRTPSGGGSGILCVCVPAFHKHPSLVLVNLRDPRDVRVHEFGSQAA